MSLYVLYEAGISATYEDITDRVRLYTLDMTQNAEEGAVALSRIVIDDPDGDYEIKGYRRLAIYEDAASFGSNALMYNGFIVDRTIIRGPYVTGAGRQWVCSVADTNCLMEFRLMVGADANRPAETDAARMTWLMSTSEMNRIPNTTFMNLSGPVSMDAVDYRGQRGVDVLNDCAQASGKNYFAFAIDAAAAPLPAAPGATHLWYDHADSSARASSIRLSNSEADIRNDASGLTYAIADDTELERDPSRVYSGALVNYDGGTAYEEDLSISNEFTRRDAIVPAENVKTNAKATARALRYLEEMSSEEDRIRTAIRLPNARVNWVREGMLVQFRASHLPGYESSRSLRVLRRTIKQDSEQEYLVTLELSTGGLTPGCIDCGSDPDFTNEYSTTVDAGGAGGSDFVVDLPWTPAECALQVAVVTTRGADPAEQGAWTTVGMTSSVGTTNSGSTKMMYRTVPVGASNVIHFNIGVPARVTVLEFTNVDTLEDVATTAAAINLSASVTSGSVTPAGNSVLVGYVLVSGSGVPGGATLPIFSIDAPMNEVDNGEVQGSQGPVHAVAYRIVTAGTYDMDVSLTVGSFTNQGEVTTMLTAFSCDA